MILVFIKIPLVLGIVLFFWYYGSPEFTDVGYRPDQPVDYSHKLHVGDLGLDCRYCHITVEDSQEAIIPPTQICMNCHSVVDADSEKLAVVRNSWEENVPIEWVRVHMLPDYSYFNHSAHVNSGVGCESCHGRIDQMEIVEQVEPLSMSWCLDCHRSPESHIRPLDQVTAMGWEPNDKTHALAKKLIKDREIDPPLDCSGCHR